MIGKTMTSGSKLIPDWYEWRYDGRGYYLLQDPEITFSDKREAMDYCDEHNRALAGKAVIIERQRIVAFLRAFDAPDDFYSMYFANAIETGEHLTERERLCEKVDIINALLQDVMDRISLSLEYLNKENNNA